MRRVHAVILRFFPVVAILGTFLFSTQDSGALPVREPSPATPHSEPSLHPVTPSRGGDPKLEFLPFLPVIPLPSPPVLRTEQSSAREWEEADRDWGSIDEMEGEKKWTRDRSIGVRPGRSAPPNEVRPPTLQGKALVVDQAAQVLRVYENGVEIRTMPISTGVPPNYTPAFVGRVGYYIGTVYGYGLWADHAWYVTEARGRILIHSAPYTLTEKGEKVYQGLEFLGVRPSSHGCIRLHPADAEWLKEWDPVGVPILITPPDLGNRQ